MTNPDVLMLDRIGGAYHRSSLLAGGLGGSEIEMIQVAHGLTAKGHRVVVANGVDQVIEEGGVTYVPHMHAWQHVPTKALYLQRFSTPETRLEIPSDVRVVVRANDVYCPPYDVHRELLSRGRATLVANTHWQADQFAFATDKAVIPPMLEPMPKVKKQPGLFVFASGAMKGLTQTVDAWMDFKHRHQTEMRDTQLVIVTPGWGEPQYISALTAAAGIRYIGNPTPKEYRCWIAKAEGLFMVLTMPETFCCAAALAERANTRTHICCLAGLGGLLEACGDPYGCITDDAGRFEHMFIGALSSPLAQKGADYRAPKDLRPTTLIDRWADVLGVSASAPATAPVFPADPTLVKNQDSLGPFFGDFLSMLRRAIAPGGSEFGTGLMLFSLATSIQAREIVEIGRFKGFSTLALAAACRLVELGWTEPKAAEQRPDVDYNPIIGKPRLVSIDPVPLPEVGALLKKADLSDWDLVDFRNVRSDAFTPERPIDLLFIDGGHSVADVRSDLHRYVPWVRPGGYFILHDYFGWFTPDGQNGSPIAQVIAEDLQGCDRVLIDTHYASLVIFRKAQRLTERWELDPKPATVTPRADGRPTVGLCVIAKGDEVSTVVTRAIVSAKKAGVDCISVVCDANESTADVARALGVDVFVRPSPPIDWDRGFGVIAGARNEALAIAERRTDYVLVLDADDYFEGELPQMFDRDAYEVTIYDGGLQYRRVQLFRSSLGWRYHGIIHEALTMDGCGPIGHLDGLRYMRGHSSYGYQDHDPPAIKYSKHAHLVSKWLHDHPDDARAQFYLARSYHDAGRLDEAIAAYEKRITMLNGWEEERSHASYQIGRILMQQGKDPTAALIRAHELGVPKAEPLLYLARWYRDDARRQFSTAYMFARRALEIPKPAGGIFLETSVYDFEAAAEVAICAYWVGQKQEALDRFERLLLTATSDRRKWIEQMIALCRRELSSLKGSNRNAHAA